MDDLMQRAVYICTSCAGVYADAPVSQCDCLPDKNEFTEARIYTEDQLREYAKKAVEAEREACAGVCDIMQKSHCFRSWEIEPKECAKAIRARASD